MALRFFQGGVKSWHKKPNDPVSEADIAVDQMLHDRLTAARPDYSWLSEESGKELRSGRHRWIVDPIDGPRAFNEGKTEFTVCVQSEDSRTWKECGSMFVSPGTQAQEKK